MSFFHCYRPHRFTAETQKTLDRANIIINEMQAQGYTLTLRQLYYQFVGRDWMENQDSEYKRLGRLITSARESGVLDWHAIEDRGRGHNPPFVQETCDEVLRSIQYALHLDKWANQDTYLEVWVEKQALEGVIARPCKRRNVTYMACKGYLSASEAWRAGQRFQAALMRGKTPIMIHLADHDPSGMNMTEDNTNRIHLFAESHSVEVKRIALNMDQVEQYNPPPNPAKEKDSRSKPYIEKYGHSSWELDALTPRVLDDLITDTVEEYIDLDKWQETLDRQDEARIPLEALEDNWDQVLDYMTGEGLV